MIVIKNVDEFVGILKNETNVFVMFSASWCGPCKETKPLFKRVSDEYPNISFVYFDCEKNKEMEKLAEEGEIEGYPTFISFFNGKERKTRGGSMDEDEMKIFLNESFHKNVKRMNVMKKTPSTPPQPFDYQQIVIRDLEQWNRSRIKNSGYIEMPTGSGKTFTAAKFLHDNFLNKGKNVLWMAESQVLLDQAKEAFVEKIGFPEDDIGTIRGPIWDPKLLTFGMVQSMRLDRRFHRLAMSRDRPDIVIFDEFHRSGSPQTSRMVEYANNTQGRAMPFLGLSATPFRTDQWETYRLIHGLYPEVISVVGMEELINKRYLATPVLKRVIVDCEPPRRIMVTQAEKDYFYRMKRRKIPESLKNKIGEQDEYNAKIVATYKNERDGCSTLAFCCNIAHAERLAIRFRSQGVPSASITQHTNDSEVSQITDDFLKGKIKVLTSVEKLTTGYDVPNCDTIFLCRPTQSRILFRQMIGRGMRGKHTGGKDKCFIYDFVNVFANFHDLSATANKMNIVPENEIILSKKTKDAESYSMTIALAELFRELSYKYPVEEMSPEELEQLFKEILIEEIEIFIPFWDDYSKKMRTMVVPKESKMKFQEAIELFRGKVDPESSEIEKTILARKTYRELAMGEEGDNEDDWPVNRPTDEDGFCAFLANLGGKEFSFPYILTEKLLQSEDFHEVIKIFPKILKS